METVDIDQAKTHLSRLMDRVLKGESFIIAKSGKPVERIVPMDNAPEASKKRRIGFMKGMIKTPDDFDTMMAEEIEEMFYGKPDEPGT